MNFEDYREYCMDAAKALLAVDSPSGFTARAIETAEGMVRGLGYPTRRTNKGNLIITVEGRDNSSAVGLCAHVDTLGLIVRSVTDKGELKVTKVGGAIMPTLDGEYCRIYTRDGRIYTGAILSLSPAVHVYDDAGTRTRDEKNMCVRIDEKVQKKEDVAALGIRPGDYVCYDPKTTVTESGFLKSRFIDDKASAALLITLLKLMKDHGVRPQYQTEITFSVYEEVGHGGATLPAGLKELLVVDMGCVGDDLSCTEYQVSICANDSAGPFDYEMVTRLINLAEQNKLSYAVDVYPHYSSDAAAAWRSGDDVRAALIGTGVHASHGMERTHWEGLLNTLKLISLYLDLK